MKWIDLGLLVLSISSLSSLLQCPYSKVEESFNLQATHDLYYHGLGPALRLLRRNTTTRTNLQTQKDAGTTTNNNNDTIDNDDLMNANVYLYDHLQYPGVVPRTFIGPIILSSLLKLITALLYVVSYFVCYCFGSMPFNLLDHPLLVQTLSRGLLMALNVHAFHRLANAVDAYYYRNQDSSNQQKQPLLGFYFLLITASQFHIPFYLSRMLPNTFALWAVTHAYAEWWNDQPYRSLRILIATTVIFRCDVLLLLATCALSMLYQRQIEILPSIRLGIETGVVSLVCTVGIDSLLWGKLLWPEGMVFFANTVENQSVLYGTLPYAWYFVSAIPKGMICTVVLLPCSFVRLSQWLLTANTGSNKVYKAGAGAIQGTTWLWDWHWWNISIIKFLLPIVGFIAIYSVLPHKEIRFIFIAFPILNVMAAKSIESMHVVAMMAVKELKGRRRLFQQKDPTQSQNQKSQHGKHDCDNDTKKRNIQSWVLVLVILLFLGGICTIGVTLVGNVIFISVSKRNYPGGHAMYTLIQRLGASKEHIDTRQQQVCQLQVHIYVDVASAMTGVSLFGQRALMQECPNCNIVKGGYETENTVSSIADSGTSRGKCNGLIEGPFEFEYIISEESDIDGYQILDVVPGHPRLNFKKFRIDTIDAIFVLQKQKKGSARH